MNTFNKSIITLTLALSTAALTACGGGGGGGSEVVTPEPPTVTPTTIAAGRAIDGYIVGATVFYDFNMNGVADAGEPSALTEEGGVFTIQGELTEEQEACLRYVPMIADVPVGAIDEDLGVVEEAYVLSFPPAFVFDVDLDRQGLNVTPISTILWESALANITTDMPNGEYTCAAVAEDATLRQAVGDAMRNVTNDMVFHFNVSEEKLYEDYIATGNVEYYELAQDLMKAIRKGFDETYALSIANPGKHVNVAYYKNEQRDQGTADNDWYKLVLIQNDDVREEVVYKVDADWNNDVLVIDSIIEYTPVMDGEIQVGTMELIREYRTHDTTNVDYLCKNTEKFSSQVVTGSTYSQSIASESITWDTTIDSCDALGFDVNGWSVTVTVTNSNRDENEIGTKAGYKWNSIPAEFAAFVGFSADVENFDLTAFEAEAQILPVKVGQDLVGADWWSTTDRYVDGAGNTFNEMYSSDSVNLPNGNRVDVPVRYVVWADGTQEYQCLNDGNWEFCSNP